MQVWLWRIDPAAARAADQAVLSPAERARADRFVYPPHQAAFRRAHAGLRHILGRLLGQPPASLDFATEGHGKPVLAGTASPPLQFNLSHSGGLAALAVARFPLGLDIEAARPVADDLAARYFSPAECAALAALPPAQREAGFFNAWTRKEAYLKATATGLATPLASFSVSLAPGAAAALLDVAGQPAEAAQWQCTALDLAPPHAGAVAARRHGWAVRLIDAEAVAGGAPPSAPGQARALP